MNVIKNNYHLLYGEHCIENNWYVKLGNVPISSGENESCCLLPLITL